MAIGVWKPSAPSSKIVLTGSTNLYGMVIGNELDEKRDDLRRVMRRPSGLPLLEHPSVSDGVADAAETREAVLEAVDGLPESQRFVVREHWLSHRTHAEIATELGISRSAVKVRAHRAYQSLRRALEAKGYAVQ